MYSRILFAIDDDEALAAAVPVVAAYGRAGNAYVHVFHAQRFVSGARSGASRRLVKDVVTRLHAEGVRAEGEVRHTEDGLTVGALIIDTAQQMGADLVAIGSHGRTEIGSLLRGSVSHEVARGLDVPVLVIRAGSTVAAEPRTVLVGVDGSAASDEAVAEAADVAATLGARVIVVHVQPMTASVGAAIVEPDDVARAIVRRAMAAVEARGVKAVGDRFVQPSTTRGLVDAAEREQPDLVVLGSRRPSHLSGLLLGSVGHGAIHRLLCPVLLAGRVPKTVGSGP